MPERTATVGATCASVPVAEPSRTAAPEKMPGTVTTSRSHPPCPPEAMCPWSATITNVVVSACRPADQAGDVGVDLAGHIPVLSRGAAERVPRLIQVGKVHHQKLGIGRLGDAKRIVHERARQVAALRPGPQRHASDQAVTP